VVNERTDPTGLSPASADAGAAAGGAETGAKGAGPGEADDLGDVRRPNLIVGLLELMFGRAENQIFGSVILLAAVVLLFAGLRVVGATPTLEFSYSGAIDGILSQLSVTGPAALLVGVATAVNVFAGALILRLATASTFRSVTDLVLGGYATAAIVDAAILFVLGSVGLFGWPELLLFHLGVFVLGAAVWWRTPGFALFEGPIRVSLRRPLAWWPLVIVLWAGPVIIQLASPAAPFMDVLPNHVAPVEHVRAFGSFATLTTSPSPIYGTSRLMLGYVGVLGTLTTVTSLHAVLAEAAFATPLLILVAMSLRRAASALFGGSASYWILLTFPLSFAFLRISDTRGTIAAFPLALFALAAVAEELRVVADRREAPSFRPDLGLTFALAGAVLIHPLIGMFAWVAVLGVLILYPTQLGPRVIPALGGSAVMSLPQIVTMAAIAAPSWIGFVLVVAGVAVAFGLAAGLALVVRALRDTEIADVLAEWSFDSAPIAGLCRVLVVVVGIGSLLRITQTHLNLDGDYPEQEFIAFARLLALCLFGAVIAIVRPQRGWILLGCAIGGATAAWATASLIGEASLTQKAIHYEVPKTIEYWIPVMLALGGAAAISAVWRLRWLSIARPLFAFLFLAVALYPYAKPVVIGPVRVDTSVIEAPLVDDITIGEHRGAESLGQALRIADVGYWSVLGYPDTRNIIDEQRQQVVDEIRSLEAQGKIGPNTQILHIASDFQQWTSVPIGVFTGAMETSVSFNPAANIHTEGGRLYPFSDLATQMATRPGYVVLEPQNFNQDEYDQVATLLKAGGYRQIWSNWQAAIYER
jgi:hypothetical protein